MIRTILFMIVFWVFMIFSLVFLIPILFFSIPGISQALKQAKERYVLSLSRFWARFVLFTAGAKINVQGLENLPEDKNLCFVSNHQSYFDIPVIMASVPRTLGFMSKKELQYTPFLSTWMKQIGCIFLDRKNPKQALQAFENGAKQIGQGKAKLIFPEGTRSRGPEMGEIKTGSMKLAFRAQALIIPITIDGTYRFLEGQGKIKAGEANLVIHPPVQTGGLSREDQKEVTQQVARQIASGFKH